MALADKLDVWKKDLIDMSRRNALLYYKADGPRPSGLSLQHADISLLYQKLVMQRASITETLLTLPDPDDDPAPMKRLERLRIQARDDAKERGVQSLYMAFGTLEWYEATTSETPAYSPILLVPVAINRSAARSLYTIACVEDEDIEINPTLHEWLLNSFHVILPTYLQCREQVTANGAAASDEQQRHSSKSTSRPLTPQLSDILSGVEAALAALPSGEQRRWSVRREANLARFSFQKLVMRQDLERHQGEALAHPALQRLGGERGALKDPAGLISVDQLDNAVRPADMLEILDADSSQQEAIQAAKAGQSFVLQGPPGTGKSQTIANIIAECLGQSKTVLFVSEKMAALDVVRKRLQAAGLGEFLLDLHDAKQNKRAFVSELDEAVKRARQAASTFYTTEWKQDSELLEQERDRLNEYVRQLHANRFALDISAYDAYGRLALLASAPATDAGVTDDIKRVTPAQFEHMRESLRQLLDYQDVLDAYWSHPWRETSLTSLASEQASAIEHHFDRLSAALSHTEDDLTQVAAALGEPDAAITFGWAATACERLRLGLESPLPPAHWFRADVAERLRPILAAARSAAAVYHDTHRALDGGYSESVYQLDQQRLLDTLTNEFEDAIAIIRPLGAHDPHDVALSNQQELDQRLAASASLLRNLAASASRVAEMLGFSAPSTLDQIMTLVRQAEVISTSPMPPRTWLDPDVYAEARIVALDACDKALWARKARSGLSAQYLPAYLETDMRSLDSRFHERYDSFVRFILPQYYFDVHALRRLLQPGVRRTADELRADVATAAKLSETEAWLKDHRAVHARLLGRQYNGEQTDWAQVRAMVEWADTFYSIFEDVVSEDVSRLVTGPASVRAQLIAELEPLTEEWRVWEANDSWLAGTLDTRKLLKQGSNRNVLDASAYAIALEHLLQSLQRFWQAASEMRSVRRDHVIPSWRNLVSDLRRAQEAHAFDIWLAANHEQLEDDLGSDYEGVATNWEQVGAALAWAEDFMRPYLEGIPEPIVQWIARGPDIRQRRQRIKDLRAGALQRLSEVEEELEYLDRSVIARTQLCARHITQDNTEIASMRQRVEFLGERLPLLSRWVACGQRIMDCRALGLGALIDTELKGNIFPRDIIDVFERRFYGLWLDAALAQSPVLKRFAGETQDRLIQRFRQLDLEHMALAQRRLAMLLRQRRYEAQKWASAAGESNDPDVVAFGRSYSRLVREAQKKRSPAIRQIVRSVFDALIQVKPCWMMSPLTVSQFIESAKPVFDLVIFDEASQVLTEDAICAILRGRQLIVVGDEKQLPPTSFFAKSIADEDDDEDSDEAQIESAESERTESILKEMLSANITARSLRWHYRSQHESLIAFSNSEFYGGQLITFPGTEKEHGDGVRFEYVADGIYDYGGTRTNRREAERVVDVLIRLAQRSPGSSLGVVALSGAQQNAIREALVNRFKAHPELAAIKDKLDEDSADDNAFFVKNLESVQGDERDMIVLSIGYGPDKHGVVHRNFGPVNRKGGERRLNVAITRARQHMVVVSSIKASDINPTGSVSVQALRRYLAFAEMGISALRSDPTSVAEMLDAPQFDSPFEQAVFDALSASGLQLVTQVGCSGYRIDLAARDPEQPDRYVLGIECDGRSYHSSKTARDRDRLRQAHLESLGWVIHRIWSSDWFADPKREIEKTLRAFEEAREKLATRASERVS